MKTAPPFSGVRRRRMSRRAAVRYFEKDLKFCLWETCWDSVIRREEDDVTTLQAREKEMAVCKFWCFEIACS